MWHSRLFWKLFLVASGLNLALTIVFSTTVSIWQEETLRHQIDSQLRGVANMLQGEAAVLLDSDNQAALQRLVRMRAKKTSMRMTIIAPEGTVLADSEKKSAEMENHRDRVEVQSALAEGIGISSRLSPTLQIPMRYLAIPIFNGKSPVAVARVALKMDQIESQVANQKRFLWSLAAIAILVAVLLSYTVVGRVIRPLSQLTLAVERMTAGEQVDPIRTETQDEIAQLANAFNHMQKELTSRVQELAQNNEQMTTILESMIEGVMAIDSNETLILANPASGKLLGFSSSQVIGRKLQEVFRCHPLHEIALKALNQNAPCTTDFDFAGETPRKISAWAGPLPDASSPGALLVLQDVTELRKLETMRQDFVANVSHELKTPLSAIKAFSETLRLGAIDDPEHNLGFVKRIEEQADRLHALILDLLTLSRVESGKQEPNPSPISLFKLVENRIQEHLRTSEIKEVQLRIQANQEDLSVVADEEFLTTILDNLLLNAIHYNQPGGLVEIQWELEDGFCLLAVEDNGVGIAPQDQERVFERFFRADRARSSHLGSTGLGLAIVKHLSQSLGGTVELTSRLGKGSRFTVRFPSGKPE